MGCEPPPRDQQIWQCWTHDSCAESMPGWQLLHAAVACAQVVEWQCCLPVRLSLQGGPPQGRPLPPHEYQLSHRVAGSFGVWDVLLTCTNDPACFVMCSLLNACDLSFVCFCYAESCKHSWAAVD